MKFLVTLLIAGVFGVSTIFGYASSETPKAKLQCVVVGYKQNKIFHEFTKQEMKKLGVTELEVYKRKIYEPRASKTYEYLGSTDNSVTLFKNGKTVIGLDLSDINDELVTVLITKADDNTPLVVMKCLHK